MEVLLGLAGGCASEALKWYRIREELHKGVPAYAKSWLYWTVTGIMATMGGLLVFAYQVSDEVSLSPILALNIGASAPLILGTLAGRIPHIDPGRVG